MKSKNQQHFTSEVDAKERLIVYVYEYLVHCGAKQAADTFKENIGYNKDIKVTEGSGFLLEWWCVFWDLYCAAPERRLTQPESSNDARAFHDFMRNTPMSPSITQASPPQQQPPPQFIGGPRYGPPPGQPPRGPLQRMQGPPQHGPLGGFIPSASPRYAQHSGQPPHMNQGPPPMGFGPGPDQMGPSPGLNHRMTPVGGQPQQHQVIGQPSNGLPPQQMVGMSPGQQHMGVPPQGQGPSQVISMQGGMPPRNGSQGNNGGGGGGGGGGWQVNVGYNNVNSPANQQPCYTSGPGSNQPNQAQMMMGDGGMMDLKNSPINGGGVGGEPSTPHSDEYVMPVPFSQETADESAEILKLKQSMQEDTKMFEKEQSDFNLGDYSDSQGKWS